CPAHSVGRHLGLLSFPTRRSSDLLLGHATPDLALRVYTAVYAEDLKRAALDLTGGLSGGLPSELDRTRTGRREGRVRRVRTAQTDRKSTRLNSSHVKSSYAVFCLQ